MKKALTSALVFLSLYLSAQNDSSSIEVIEPPDSTAIGLPDGKKMNVEIGPKGGKINSEDGRVELIFPAGALKANTMISIQPVTNMAPNGAGKAYEFEPSGIQFQKPVQLIFHYTDEEAESSPADLMGLAIQDKRGKWSFFNYEKWDSTAKTLKGFIHHFSSVSNVHKIGMFAGRVEVPVNDTTSFIFLDITKKFGPNDTGIPEDKLFVEALFEKRQNITWYANGIKGGNNLEGTVDNIVYPLGREKTLSAMYQAPATLPGRNPVIIRADIYIKAKTKKLQRTLQYKLFVYDTYRVQIIHEFTGRPGMGSKLMDSASFRVIVSPLKIEIDGIKNYAPVVIKEGKAGDFKEKIDTRDALGSIQITEFIKNEKLSHDYPPEVYFEFPSYEILAFKAMYSARGIKSPLESSTIKSIPEEINFIANGKEQHYDVTKNNTNYKLVVKPLRSD
jgi:hypothetical protein